MAATRFPAVLIPLAVLACSSLASASGFTISKMGGDLSGPTEPNAAAVFWNPGAIGPISGQSVMLDVNFAWRTMDYERAWPEDQEDLNPGDRPNDPGRMSTFDVLPMVALTARPGLDWLTLGLAFYVPYGNRSDWPVYDLEAQRELPAGEQRPIPPQAYHTLTGGIEMMHTTLAVSISPLRWWGIDWLWFGIGGTWIYAQVDATRVKDYSPDIEDQIEELVGVRPDLPAEIMDNSGMVKLDFAGHAFSLNCGLYARPWEFLRLGISYTALSHLKLPGTTELSLPPIVASTFGSGAAVDSNAQLHMILPPALRFGVHVDIAEWLVFRAHAEWVLWSYYKDVRIHGLALADENGPVEGLADTTEFASRRDYKDAIDVRTGFRFIPVPWWMIFVGVGYDSNAIPDATNTPDLFDAEKVGLALGTWIQIVPLLERLMNTELGRDDMFGLAVGVTWVKFLDRTVTTSQADPPIAGDYRSNVVLLNTNLEARF